MKIKRVGFSLLFIVLLITFPSCNKDEPNMVETEAIDDSVEDTMDDDITDVTPDDTLGNVEYFNSSLVEDSYILVNDAGNNRA